MAWNETILQAAIDDPTCKDRENVYGADAQCQTLLNYKNVNSMESCKLEEKIVIEDMGITHPIKQAPGCNPPSGPGLPSLTCQSPVPTPTMAYPD